MSETVFPARPRTTRFAEGRDRRAFTVAEVERMLDAGILRPDERFELLEGEIVPVAPERARHANLKLRLNRFFTRGLADAFAVYVETTLRLSPLTFVEPDLVVMRGQLTDAAVPAADILLVIEIAESSLRHDLERKSVLYAGHGVPELWIMDAETRDTHVHRAPGPDGYAEIARHAPEAPLVPLALPAVSLRAASLIL